MLSVPVEESPYERVVLGLEQLTALANSTDAYRCAFVAEFAARHEDERDVISGIAMLFQTTYGKARAWVETSKALKSLPEIAAVFAQGRLGFEKVSTLAQIATPETDAALAKDAPDLSIPALRRLAREVKKRDDVDPEDLHSRRSLTYHWDADHTMLSFEGKLPQEIGDAFVKAVEREMDQQYASADLKNQPYYARAADALTAIVSNEIASDADPDLATVVVHTDLSLLTRGEGLADTEAGTPLDRATALRLACDCRLQMIVHGDDGAVVEVSTTTYTVPRWMRRQLKKRDRCCQFPGCGNTRFLHAHHIERWTPDAPDTSLSNLVLLCPLHHDWVHHRGWQPRLDPVTAVVDWTKPDGTPHDPGPPLRDDFHDRLLGPLLEPIRESDRELLLT